MRSLPSPPTRTSAPVPPTRAFPCASNPNGGPASQPEEELETSWSMTGTAFRAAGVASSTELVVEGEAMLAAPEQEPQPQLVSCVPGVKFAVAAVPEHCSQPHADSNSCGTQVDTCRPQAPSQVSGMARSASVRIRTAVPVSSVVNITELSSSLWPSPSA